MNMSFTATCLICGKPVHDYIPDFCCGGYQCGCMGKPTNPCTCSDECDEALYTCIGDFEDRRIKADIPKYQNKKAPKK